MPVRLSKFYKGVFILADKKWDWMISYGERIDSSTTEEMDNADWDPLTSTGQSRIRKIVALIFHEAVKLC